MESSLFAWLFYRFFIHGQFFCRCLLRGAGPTACHLTRQRLAPLLHNQEWEAVHTQKTTFLWFHVVTGHQWEQVGLLYVWTATENWGRGEEETLWGRKRAPSGWHWWWWWGGGGETRWMNWTIRLIRFMRRGLQHVCLFMRPRENDLVTVCSINGMVWKKKNRP